MSDAVLVLNAGSSSLKFAVYRAGHNGNALSLLVRGSIAELHGRAHFRAHDAAGAALAEHAWTKAPHHDGALRFLLRWLDEAAFGARLVAVGHRVVHGGTGFIAPVHVDVRVLQALHQLSPLAPLHQPHSLNAIEALMAVEPRLLQVACFDTAFHHTNAPLATAFALPASITGGGIRRYGFHGLSCEYIAGELPRHDAQAAQGRTVIAHLGNGASLTALRGGRSVATTMGMTALDGLMMGTRPGALDAGVVLLLQQRGMDLDAIQSLLYNESGLLGVSGVSSDMRTLLASAEPRAKFAIDLFVYRIVRELGSMAAALGGLDAIVFTAGIGERAAPVRKAICEGSSWLGIVLDNAANTRSATRISNETSRVAVWVLPTDEERVIARHTIAVAAAV